MNVEVNFNGIKMNKNNITGITVLGPLKTIHPLYQIFGVRLEMINFDNIIIFKTNMSFGHAGASGRFDYLKEAADDLVFITNIFKVK
jgi:hypothetical protein